MHLSKIDTMPAVKCSFFLLVNCIGLDKVGHVTKEEERFSSQYFNVPKKEPKSNETNDIEIYDLRQGKNEEKNSHYHGK